MLSSLTHLNEKGEARMVDVGTKAITARLARAEGFIAMPSHLIDRLTTLKKGNAYEVARLAGIMGAKKTADLIPLCHNLDLDNVSLKFQPDPDKGRVRVQAEARCHGRTGVELEALTAVSVALLTLYDMGKAVERGMEITGIKLLHKSGGKSSAWSP
uniref:cyclic pyranopterin monophosphate synthase n=1 Tax=Candidatus Kentrum eta TaxID=2126337 RepID=A0A450V6A2_9GAMM|nr:MAG: cyclic pyranopterin monophosphate synthase subunit MoaC [Candidatus Kentron sp. H]VFK00343.1 MAG: cyclic pyranopterin monophosphate synthase subunit MoaC [Candidatus Kentron sp. H]VFK04511.1 MAG: cyclic pyranopterin monophosphate synthase subunit MoaC [Candidatus Kentron sp. H]